MKNKAQDKTRKMGKQDFPYFGTLWKSVLVFLLAVSVLPLAGVAFGMYRYASRAITQNSMAYLKMETEHKKTVLDARLAEQIRLLNLAIIFFETTPASTGAIESGSELSLFKTHGPSVGMVWLGVYDDKGSLLKSTGNGGAGNWVADAPWFKAALQKKPRVEVIKNSAPENRHFFISLSVTAPAGPKVVRAEYVTTAFYENAFPAGLPVFGHAAVMDEPGIWLAGSTKSITGPCPLPGDRFDGVRTLQDDEGICAFSYLENAPWILTARITRKDTLGGLETVRNVGLFVLALVAVLIVGTVFDVTNYLVGRLEHKRKKIHELGHKLRHAGRAVISLHYITEMTAEMKDIFNNIDLAAKWIKEQCATGGGAIWTNGEISNSVHQIQSELARGAKAIDTARDFIVDRPPVISFFHLHEVLDQAVAFFDREIRFNSIHVSRNFCSNPLMIKNDRSQIRQVFTHLVHYCICAVPKSGGEITLLTEKTTGGVRIRMADNGPEIPPEQIVGIFDPDFSGKEGKPELGLSVCRQVLDNLGGAIKVENRFGSGLMFTVDLPEAFAPKPFESGARL